MDGNILLLNREEYKIPQEDDVEIPEPPEFLSFEAKLEWLRSAPDLVRKGKLLEGGNIALFENFCICIGIVRECLADIEVQGKILGTKTGYIPNPSLKIMNDNMTQSKNIYQFLCFGKNRENGEEIKEEDNWGKDKGLLA